MLKNPPANAGDIRDMSLILRWEDPLEKEMEKEPTPIFLPGESYEQRSLMGYSPQCRKELLDTNEATSQHT